MVLKHILSFILLMNLSFIHANEVKTSHKAQVGVYITHIYDINLQKRTVTLVFWLWIRYPSDAYKDNKIDFINAHNSEILYKSQQTLDNGQLLVQYKVHATLHQNWTFEHFPFSSKSIQIAIEDSDYNIADLQFTADLDNLSHIDSSTSPSGWKIKGSSWRMINHQYDTSFGKLKPKHHIDYSRAIFSLDITNEDMRIFIHIFGMLYLASFLIFGMFFVPISDIKSRLALNSAAIFAVIGSKIATDSLLPPSNHINLVDKIQLCTLIFMAVTLLTVLLNYHLYQTKPKIARFINLSFALITLFFILLSNIFFIQY